MKINIGKGKIKAEAFYTPAYLLLLFKFYAL
jgi:hypothetical protein